MCWSAGLHTYVHALSRVRGCVKDLLLPVLRGTGLSAGCSRHHVHLSTAEGRDNPFCSNLDTNVDRR